MNLVYFIKNIKYSTYYVTEKSINYDVHQFLYTHLCKLDYFMKIYA